MRLFGVTSARDERGMGQGWPSERKTVTVSLAAEIDCATWANFFLKYVLGEPRITNVIPATRKVKHLNDNMNAGLGRLPDPAMRRKMVAYIESL